MSSTTKGGNDEDHKSFIDRITGLLDKLKPKKNKDKEQENSKKSSKGSHHSKERTHSREHKEGQTVKDVKPSTDSTIKVSHTPSKKPKKRVKSACWIPPRDSDGDVTVFEGIRGRMKPAKSKLSKKKKKNRFNFEDSDSTKSEYSTIKKDDEASTKSAVLPFRPSNGPKKAKKPKTPQDSDSESSERDIISLLGAPEERNSSTKAIMAPTFDPEPSSTVGKYSTGFSVSTVRLPVSTIGVIQSPSGSSKSTPPSSPSHTKTDNWFEIETGDAFPDKNTLVPAAKSTLDDQCQEQYVVYRYVNTRPVMGRAWNEEGKLVASFPFKGRELRTVGAEVLLLLRPTPDADFNYEWRPFDEAAQFDMNKHWHPVRVGDNSPGIISATQGKILGQVDIRHETAAYSFNDVGIEIVGPEVHRSLVLCRKDL